MSYLHCPTCARAYNVTREPACPRCGVRAGTPLDPTDDVVTAVEQLARAMARATPYELAAARATLDARSAQLALPAPNAPVAPPPEVIRTVRAVLEPPPAPKEVQPSWTGSLRALFMAKLAPRLPASTTAPILGFASRVRATLSRARTLLAA